MHVDVKNANFCTRCEDTAAGSAGGSQLAARDGGDGAAAAIRNSPEHRDVVLVDFGFAQVSCRIGDVYMCVGEGAVEPMANLLRPDPPKKINNAGLEPRHRWRALELCWHA